MLGLSSGRLLIAVSTRTPWLGDDSPDAQQRNHDYRWLLDSDPAVRWQTMADLTDAPADEVAAERAKVGSAGWGAEVLARQTPTGDFGGAKDGNWGGDEPVPEWTTLLSLLWLRDMGVDPEGAPARAAIERVRDNVTWHWWDNNPFFVGEVEPCINGRVLSLGAYFGQDTSRVLDRLLGEQMADGGWNCEQENGATVGSFHTTINVLEGLAGQVRTFGATPAVADALARGNEYLLDRRLLRRRRSGELIDPNFSRLSFPTGYHYDVLRALEHFRSAGTQPDARMDEAIDIVRSKRRDDGRWNLENPHEDQLEIGVHEREGEPSRWITLRAFRVLSWADAP
jgi:hypothetical protein